MGQPGVTCPVCSPQQFMCSQAVLSDVVARGGADLQLHAAEEEVAD